VKIVFFQSSGICPTDTELLKSSDKGKAKWEATFLNRMG